MSKPYDASLNKLIQEHATDWGHYLARSFGLPMYFLSGLRYKTEELARLLQGLAMIYQDSATYQDLVQSTLNRGIALGKTEGLVENSISSIIRIGTKRLGAPPSEVHGWLQTVRDLDHLNRLFDAVLDVSSWDELAQVS